MRGLRLGMGFGHRRVLGGSVDPLTLYDRFAAVINARDAAPILTRT